MSPATPHSSPPITIASLFDETKTDAIHLIRVWHITDSFSDFLASKGFYLEQHWRTNSYTWGMEFTKHGLSIFVRAKNQSSENLVRLAEDGLHYDPQPASWALDIAIPRASHRLQNSVHQAVLAITAAQPQAYARNIIVRPYQAIWPLVEQLIKKSTGVALNQPV